MKKINLNAVLQLAMLIFMGLLAFKMFQNPSSQSNGPVNQILERILINDSLELVKIQRAQLTRTNRQDSTIRELMEQVKEQGLKPRKVERITQVTQQIRDTSFSKALADSLAIIVAKLYADQDPVTQQSPPEPDQVFQFNDGPINETVIIQGDSAKIVRDINQVLTLTDQYEKPGPFKKRVLYTYVASNLPGSVTRVIGAERKVKPPPVTLSLQAGGYIIWDVINKAPAVGPGVGAGLSINF